MGLALIVPSIPAGTAPSGDWDRAEQLFRSAQYEASSAILKHHERDAHTEFLLGRNQVMMGEFKRGEEALSRAVALDAGNSAYWTWLGRAYGRRSEASNMLFAPILASKSRQSFERALEIDPDNREALSELFDYYLSQPLVFKGGLVRAGAIADHLTLVDPGEGDVARGRLASREPAVGRTERSLRQAVAAAPREVTHLLTLAISLAHQGKTRESDAVFVAAQKEAPNAPSVWFVRADTLIAGRRNLDEARTLLQRYVQASIAGTEPAKEEAFRLLKQAGGA